MLAALAAKDNGVDVMVFERDNVQAVLRRFHRVSFLPATRVGNLLLRA